MNLNSTKQRSNIFQKKRTGNALNTGPSLQIKIG